GGGLGEMGAGDEWIARQGLERELERPAHHAVDDELVLLRIDVRDAAVIDREVQRVRRDGAVEQMMRRARMRVAELALGIAQRPRHALLESRRRLQRRRDLAELEAPRLVLERLGRRAGPPGGAPGARHRTALP